jgi:hypothetical protein
MINILGALELAAWTRTEADFELLQSAPPINQSFCCYELLSIDVVECLMSDKPTARVSGFIGQSKAMVTRFSVSRFGSVLYLTV